MSTEVERFVRDKNGMRFYQQERAIMQVTELICNLMDQQKISRARLATLLGKSRSHVTQLLDGEANMTIRTLSDVFTALGCEMNTYASEITIGVQADSTASASSSPRWETRNWPVGSSWTPTMVCDDPVAQV